MILKKVKQKVGTLDMETNCYVIIDEETKRAMVVDPIKTIEPILDILKYNEAILEYIVLTHCHGDHISGLVELKNETNAKVCIHVLDSDGLRNEMKSLTYFVGVENPNIIPDVCLQEGDILTLGSIEFQVIHTPGHTEGSICLYSEGILLSGDTLFKGTWGRTDLPTSSFESIISSIENKLMKLPNETIIYPGHGKSSIIKDEKNIYLNLKYY